MTVFGFLNPTLSGDFHPTLTEETVVFFSPAETSASIQLEPSYITTVSESPSVELTEVTEESCNYDCEPMDLDYSFEEIMNVWSDYIGVGMSYHNNSDDSYFYHENEHEIQYISDYRAHLGNLVEISPSGADTSIPETDRHIIRTFMIDGIWLAEYDDDYWAEASYQSDLNYAMTLETTKIYGSYSDGYYFVYDDSESQYIIFLSRYYWGRYSINFKYCLNSGRPENYAFYIELCNVLDLPTCDDITQIILGSSGE